MKIFAFVLMMVMLAVAVFAGPTESGKQKAERKCVPGKTYNDGCNTCFCNDGGFKYCNQFRCPESNTPPIEAPEDFWQKTQ